MCESLLVFIITGDIVLPVLDGVGQVLLGGPVVGVVMRVEVVLPLDLGVGAVVMLVLQLARDGPGAPGLNVRNGGIDASWAELDLGAVATSDHASASGRRASGRPTALAMSTAALTMGMICGQARPTSSHAQTINGGRRWQVTRFQQTAR